MPFEKPLPVALSAVMHENKILLVKRVNEPYAGKWAFPGGKIEPGEHVSEAAIRELLEESGIKSSFKEHLGLVSEHLMENNSLSEHFLLHVCELTPQTLEAKNSPEGEVEWFSLNELDQLQTKMAPSDFAILEKIIKEKQRGYYECVLEKNQDEYTLKKFE